LRVAHFGFWLGGNSMVVMWWLGGGGFQYWDFVSEPIKGRGLEILRSSTEVESSPSCVGLVRTSRVILPYLSLSSITSGWSIIRDLIFN
jgi:hypothetical protein